MFCCCAGKDAAHHAMGEALSFGLLVRRKHEWLRHSGMATFLSF